MKELKKVALNPANEIAALESVAGMEAWLPTLATDIAKAAGGQALSWLTGQLFSALGQGNAPLLQKINAQLKQVLAKETEIINMLKALSTEIQFQGMVTASFDSVSKILSLFTRLSNLGNIPIGPGRDKELSSLNSAILDPNAGVLVDLQVIDGVLRNVDPLNPEGHSVLYLFMATWGAQYRTKQFDDDTPLTMYPGKSYQYLQSVYLIQYLGLCLQANARIASKQIDIFKIEINQFAANLTKQKAIIDGIIPQWVREYKAGMYHDNRLYLIYETTYRTCLYAQWHIYRHDPPAWILGFRNSVDNPEEQWKFEPGRATDLFTLANQASGLYLVGIPGISEIDISGYAPSALVQFRFIMGPGGEVMLGAINGSIKGTISVDKYSVPTIVPWQDGYKIGMELA